MEANKVRKVALVVSMAMILVLMSFGAGLAQSPVVNVTLGMSEFMFDPAELDVTAGTEVTFNVSNTGSFPHNVTFVAPDGTETNLFAQNVAAGQSATGTFTFTTAGEWRMYCPVGQHEEQGMVGTVTVAAMADMAAAQATPAVSTTMTDTMTTTAAMPATTTATTPATLPTTGNAPVAPFAVVGGALLLLGAGLWMRREHSAQQ